MNDDLTHINHDGLPGMVDVSNKSISERIAIARGRINLGIDIMDRLKEQDFHTGKGSIIQTSIIAGTMAVKNTYQSIPFCHQLPIASCKFDFEPFDIGFEITCTVKTLSNTGVEMEALQGVSTAALAIYDMCKALSHETSITDIELLSKTGGKSDYEKAS